MPIKRIQLRGISRTPSDRMVEDGGCAESLNVHLDNTETVAMVKPTMINDTAEDEQGNPLFPSADPMNTPWECVYLHKTDRYTRAICLVDNDLAVYVNGQFQTILDLQSDEVFKGITSVGNTVIVATDKDNYYLLFKDHQYNYIGNRIPMPNVEFATHHYDSSEDPGPGVQSKVNLMTLPGAEGAEVGSMLAWNHLVWEEAAKEIANDERNDFYKEAITAFWDQVGILRNKFNKWGYFCEPVLVRYAIRLYDGTYIGHSVPILLGSSALHKNWMEAWGSYVEPTAGTITASAMNFRLHPYKATAYLKSWNSSDWLDIIAGIDVFVSTGINNPVINSDLKAFSGVSSDDIVFNGQDEGDLTKDLILSKGNFYRIASFGVRELQRLQTGYDLLTKLEFADSAVLVEQPELSADYMTSHKFAGEDIFTYNKRLSMSKIRVTYPEPYAYFCAPTDDYILADDYSFVFQFKMQRDNEQYTVRSNVVSSTKIMAAMAWIAYPSPDCISVDIEVYKNDVPQLVRTLAMAQHPHLNCSYAYYGINEFLHQAGDHSGDDLPDPLGDTYVVNNEFMQSLVNNPFAFAIEDRITIGGGVIMKVVPATKPLSTGQFGQFPYYAFTTDGIYAIALSNTGSFVSASQVSRDICIAPNSITQLDQAIAYLTDKGLMLLTGSDNVCLSEYMNGKHYVAEDGVVDMLSVNTCPWKNYVDLISDGSSFMQFMQTARMIYDYAGRRLLCFSKEDDYAYAYYFDTKTWHKLAYETKGEKFVTVINAYPKAWVEVDYEGQDIHQMGIYDYSTYLNVQDSTPVKGIIATRELDLGEPDVRKIIKAIRIRGDYNTKNTGDFPYPDVQYILLGSMDGHKFNVLHSLRAGSWKQYRIILLANLQPTETISYIDVEYETKFANKLR